MDPLSTTLPPGDVFGGLASPRIEDRDNATRLAVAMGTAVSQRLLQWDDAPPSNRARRLWAYMGIHLRRAEAAIRQPRSFDLRHEGTVASALEVLAHRHGVLVAKDLPAEAEAPVALALSSTTLLAALDEACGQASCRGGQRARGELAAHTGAEPRYPSAYHGPVRVRVIEIRTVRTTDFATSHASAQVRLRVDWEWPVTPLSSVAIQLDGEPRVYEATPVGTVVNVGVVAELVVELEPRSPLVIAGTVSSTFDGAYDDVRLTVPGSIEVHGLAASTVAGDGGCQLVLETRDPIRVRGDVGGLGLSPVVLAIDTHGEEGIPQVHRVRTVGGALGAERWGLKFRDGFGSIAELRLRVAAPPIRATFPFVVPPIVLP